MNKPTILVTGKNGQLGQELQLLAASMPAYNFIFTDRTVVDITNLGSVNDFFHQHHVDVCINAAAYTAVDKAESSREEAMQANATAVKNLAINCSEHQSLFIHVSTDYVFDGTAQVPYTEDYPTNPVNYYGQTKLDGEELALRHHPTTIILRTSWVYSRMGNNFVKTMLRLTAEKPTINVVNDQFGSPTYAADLAEVILSIVRQLHETQKNYGGVYHFSNEGIISWFDFAVEINKMAGHHCEVLPIPSSGFPTPARRPTYSAMDKQKVSTTFDVQLKDWKQSLHTCLQQIKANP